MNFSVWWKAYAISAVLGVTALADDGERPVELPLVEVTSEAPRAEQEALPRPLVTTTALAIEETINAVDPEDAAKYFPSVFLRKRNYGDTQPTLATRVWGVSSSARSLVYADGVPLSALIANNNSLGAPRWGLVAPQEIERIDVRYGPFAAAYPGNSMGAVMEITTRMPEARTAGVRAVLAWQTFGLYGTHRVFATRQGSAYAGDRVGAFSYWVSANTLDSYSQPLGYVITTLPATRATGGLTGIYASNNKLGQPANIAGTTGLLHAHAANAKVKAAYDFTPWLRGSYTFGFWRNRAGSDVETYLRDAADQPTFAGLSGFASGRSEVLQEHSMHALALKSETRGSWDFDASASWYRMDRDTQRQPSTAAANGIGFGAPGRVAVLGGTGWHTLDLKATWRSDAQLPAHTISAGAHVDAYALYNPTFNTPDWRSAAAEFTSVATEGDGKTRTQACWAQDAWSVTPALKLTFGARYERWRAYDGYNVNGASVVHQPSAKADRLSPKATASWRANARWQFTASIGQAYRFATAAELYQLVSTGTTFTAPQPNLKPDNVLAVEVRAERKLEAGRVRVSLFQDDVRDAIIAQFNPLVPGSSQLYTYLANVDHVRARGVEVAADIERVGIRGLSLSANLTYLDARTLALSGRPSASAPAAAAIGKRLPNIPQIRGALVLTYRPDPRWTFTAAGRYSDMMFTTLDNADTNPNTWQGFGAWFVADARVHCHIAPHWSAALGVDNALNRKYFLFHPFPQRTYVVDAQFTF